MPDTGCPPRPSTVRMVMREFEAEIVVAKKTILAAGVIGLRLHEVGGHDLPAWEPGAHIDLIMPGGVVRQYSLCGDPSDRRSWRIAVRRASDQQSRGGSSYLHDTLQQGAVLRVRGPRNHFRLAPSPNYVFIAGGIGITPILAMVAQAQSVGADWQLAYGGRRLESMPFLGELSRYRERVVSWPEDQRGLIDLDGVIGKPRQQTLVYCCGPQALLTAAQQRCARWPAETLHTESFITGADADDSQDTPVHVVLARHDVSLVVPPGQTILEAIEKHGIRAFSSCRSGMCGTCETRVLHGVPEHRDEVLTNEERQLNDRMMICVSRSREGTLVLDL